MSQPSSKLLSELAEARAIPFRDHRLPALGQMVSSDGIRLHYLDWPGGPETLILLHGGALSAHTFDLLALALRDEVRCVALDLRGHGASGWADEYNVERWARDVIELVDHLGLKKIQLAGMSLGGCVAGHAAVALGDKLTRLTFIDVGAEVNFAASAGLRAFIKRVRPVVHVEDLVAQALAVSPRTDPSLMLYRYQSLLKPSPGGFVWKADRRRPTDFSHILGKLAELTELAQRIPCPVLVVKGGRSGVLSQVALERFAGSFPNGAWSVLPGAGHNIQEEEPVALAGLLQAAVHASPSN